MNEFEDVEEFMEDEEKEIERRNQFPSDMAFEPFSDKFYEGAVLKTPWLPRYISYRRTYDEASSEKLAEFLWKNGAESSRLMDRYRGAMLGLAVGDALGVPLEFSQRDKGIVVKEMIGGGPFNLPRGYWTDDTSMACCLAYSLIKCMGFNAKHQMECYSYWYRYGAYSATGSCFDIGNTTRDAIEQFLKTGQEYSTDTDPMSAGNGSLMRLAPIALFYFDKFEDVVFYAAQSSRVTHAAVEAVDACRYFAALLFGALKGESKEVLLSERYSPVKGYWNKYPLSPAIDKIAAGEYKTKKRNEIHSTGYVVHTLEAVLWSFYRNETFREGLLEAVNLAGDSDTVGAIFGQLAGAFYGESSIPIDWIIYVDSLQGFYHFTEDLFEFALASREKRTEEASVSLQHNHQTTPSVRKETAMDARPLEIVGELVNRLREERQNGATASKLVHFLDQENVSSNVLNEYFEIAFNIKSEVSLLTLRKRDRDVYRYVYKDYAIDRYFNPLIDAAKEQWISATHYPDLMNRLHREIFRGFAKEHECYLIVRASNPFSGAYVGKPGYRPAPSSLIAVSRVSEPNPGLMAADPNDERLQCILQDSHPAISYDQYIKKLSHYGFVVGEEDEGYVIRDKNGVMLYPTYYIHGIYQKDNGNNIWFYPEGEKFRHELNTRFGEELVQLGAHNVWERINDASVGVFARPQLPAICFQPSASGSATIAMDEKELSEIYNYWGLKWPFSQD